MNQEKMFCTNCGNELEPGNNFCTKCGTSSNNTNNNVNIYANYQPERQVFNWTTLIGIACGIVAIFVFWLLTFMGISIEIKALQDIKNKNQKGKILAYLGISLCGAGIIVYFLGNVLSIGM